MHAALEAAKNDLKKGQERIDFLSADKRKVAAAPLLPTHSWAVA